MALEKKLTDDMKTAMKSKDKLRLSVIRMVKAKIKNAQIKKLDVLDDDEDIEAIAEDIKQHKDSTTAFIDGNRPELAEDEVLEVLAKDIKQHKDSIAAFRDGNRPDLAEKEEAELKILLEYMPQEYLSQQMSRDDVIALAKQVIAEAGATGPQDMGKVMGKIIAQVNGKADGKEVNTIVRELLAG